MKKALNCVFAILAATVCFVACNEPAPQVHQHTEIIDAAVAPTCTSAGKTEGKHCSVCGEVLTAQQNLLGAELDESSDRYAEIQGIVQLYYALGGGSK